LHVFVKQSTQRTNAEQGMKQPTGNGDLVVEW